MLSIQELSNPAPHEPDSEHQERNLHLLPNEERDRKLFIQELNKFMVDIGKPLSKIPIMGYKELDLFQLFKEVNAFGGFNEVVKNVGTWSKIWKKLANFDPSITDSSFRLKKNYERYLLEYEYKVFPEHRQQALEAEKQLQKNGPETFLPSGNQSPLTSPKTEKKGKKGKKILSRPELPLILGEVTIEAWGSLIPKPPFMTEKHIWPVGFRSSRLFPSMLDPSKRVKYTSQIIHGGDKPQFIVTAVDQPNSPIISHSPSAAWRTVLKNVMSKEGAPLEEKKNMSVSGAVRFGLSLPLVATVIKELPQLSNCDSLQEFQKDPLESPSTGRKRKPMENQSTVEAPCHLNLESKSPRVGRRNHASVSQQISEDSDLETAVETLNALRFAY
jgi:hypothetical protein